MLFGERKHIHWLNRSGLASAWKLPCWKATNTHWLWSAHSKDFHYSYYMKRREWEWNSRWCWRYRSKFHRNRERNTGPNAQCSYRIDLWITTMRCPHRDGKPSLSEIKSDSILVHKNEGSGKFDNARLEYLFFKKNVVPTVTKKTLVSQLHHVNRKQAYLGYRIGWRCMKVYESAFRLQGFGFKYVLSFPKFVWTRTNVRVLFNIF